MTDAAFWNAVVPDEEVDRDDEALNRTLRWRELRRHLGGVRTILDVGGGTGAFSIPLAEEGYEVTHLDLSPAMLAAARAKSTRPRYVEGTATDLSRFGDRAFDLVLNTDGAISFAGPAAGAVLAETCRVGKKVFVTVSHRACMTATWLKYSLKATGRILPAVHEMLRTGLWRADQSPDAALLAPVCDVPCLKAFTRDELAAALAAEGLEVLVARPLGSLGHLLLPHGLHTSDVDGLADLAESLDATFDAPGSFRRAGLLAVAAHPRSP